MYNVSSVEALRTVLDITALLFIVRVCWQGYHRRNVWFLFLPHLLMHWGRKRSYLRQLTIFAPVVIIWLLSCHWIDTHGWHAVAAGGVLVAMTMGLEAMRSIEEQQKRRRSGDKGKISSPPAQPRN